VDILASRMERLKMNWLKQKSLCFLRRIKWLANVGFINTNSSDAKWVKKSTVVSIAEMSEGNLPIRVQGDKMDQVYGFSRCGNCLDGLAILTWWQDGGAKVYYRFCIDCHVEMPR